MSTINDLRDHPAINGFELENLRQHAETPEGRTFLEKHRKMLVQNRARALEIAATSESEEDRNKAQSIAEFAAELLQRFDLVLDTGGNA